MKDELDFYKHKHLCIGLTGIRIVWIYYMGDMSYGWFLVFNACKVAYHFNFFSDSAGYGEISAFIEAHRLPPDKFLIQLLQINGLHDLSVDQRCCKYGITIPIGPTIPTVLEVEELPATLFTALSHEQKNRLKENILKDA